MEHNIDYKIYAENDNYLLLGNDKEFIVIDLNEEVFETFEISSNYFDIEQFCSIFDNDIELLQELLFNTIISKSKKYVSSDYTANQRDNNYSLLQDANGEKIILLDYSDNKIYELPTIYDYETKDLWEFLKEYTNQEFLNQYINYIIVNDYIDPDDIPEAVSYKKRVE